MSNNRIGPWDTTGPAGSDGSDGADGVPGSSNAIINGDFNIWQRGTGFSPIANDDFSADRFRYFVSGDAVHDISRSTDVPTQSESGHLSNHSIKVDCTTVDGAIDVGDYSFITHRIEGYNFKRFQGRTATLSFWVKATKTGVYCVTFRNSTADRSYISEYTVNSSDTWEKKTITLTFSESGGTWDYVNGIGLRVSWVLSSGSTFQATADTWQTGNYFATSNQVNACDNTDNNFFLSQIQFELDGVATDFNNLPIDKEIAACQRYFQKTYDFDVNPGAVDQDGRLSFQSTAHTSADHTLRLNWNFNVSMRTKPTVTPYDITGGTSGKVTMENGVVTGTISSIGTEQAEVTGTNGGASADRFIYAHLTANAEL